LAGKFPEQSPFCAFDNNPIYFTDPSGLAAEGGGDEGGDEGTAKEVGSKKEAGEYLDGLEPGKNGKIDDQYIKIGNDMFRVRYSKGGTWTYYKKNGSEGEGYSWVKGGTYKTQTKSETPGTPNVASTNPNVKTESTSVESDDKGSSPSQQVTTGVTGTTNNTPLKIEITLTEDNVTLTGVSRDIVLSGISLSLAKHIEKLRPVLNSRTGFTSGQTANGLTYNKAKTITKIRILKGTGYVLSVYAFYQNQEMLANGEITESRYKFNNMNIVVSIVFPVAAIPTVIGDYYGQKYADEILYIITEGFVGEALWYIQYDIMGLDEYGNPVKK
jgi:hypothetical protein